MSTGLLELDAQRRGGYTYVDVAGLLAESGYRSLRDDLIKYAAEAPDALVVGVDELDYTDRRLLGVFSIVAMQISDWPGTRLLVVCGRGEFRKVLTRTVAERVVSVHASLAQAERAIEHPKRRRAKLDLPRSAHAAGQAREFARSVCSDWHAGEFAVDAALVATELVENALRHTTSRPRLRLELRRGQLTVAVTDENPRSPILLEKSENGRLGLGLRLIAQAARVWGATPTWAGGKVVWAVLAPPPISRHA
jgi:anti-sigma regulatory factor (Ser/Thr protein kinase)